MEVGYIATIVFEKLYYMCAYSIPIRRECCLISCRGATVFGDWQRPIIVIGTVIIELESLLRLVIAGAADGDDGAGSSERKIDVCIVCPRSSVALILDIGSSLEVSLILPQASHSIM